MLGTGSLAVDWLAVGIALTIAGGLIKFAGWTFLLAGYDDSSPVPDDVIADIAGNTVLRIGLAVTVFGVIASVTEIPSYLPLLIEGAILLAVLRLLYRLHTYSPNGTA
ncbi:hypothetical protein [Halostella pelagica]|uniref:hypothetical protein n=1 Tax=Halostella pelagica TaxID=2583824 RepID=UPI001080EBE2|nr:hypothetical protein [Halostella pelagica]